MLNFEDIIEESWDYVSKHVISDEYWENNQKFIRELTFELYEEYKKGIIVLPSGQMVETLSAKTCGKLLESFFAKLHKFKDRIID